MAHSTTSTLVLKSPPNLKPSENDKTLAFDASLLDQQQTVPSQFMWPHEDLANVAQEEFQEPLIDLKGILNNNDQEAIDVAVAQIRDACLNHGMFQVTNHGIDESVIQSTYRHMDEFFNLPLIKKMSTKRTVGGRSSGYSGAHADRYASKLPWKETFSFIYDHAGRSDLDVVDYIKSTLGEDYEEAGIVYKNYCEEMKSLTLTIFELLAMSLGVDRFYYRKFFEDGYSLMRGNKYPSCKDANLTFGTGPHFDPNALTILHQDQVGGLEVFADNKWKTIAPHSDAFVVNIGDTFMALCNGKYKSCQHRAVVNKERARRSLVFFVNPKEDKVVSPPPLQDVGSIRHYPDFTWSDFRDFTQYHQRADTTTFQNFVHWLSSTSATTTPTNKLDMS